jgi:hypothetical protein
VDLEPADRRPGLDDGAMMRMPQSDPGADRDRIGQTRRGADLVQDRRPPFSGQAFGSRLPPTTFSQVPVGT